MKNRLTFFKRAQRGQTIVILALAFIVLLGFVGLVTDISLMFVRYNTLRRAVDSAAVAAAGQMRRAVATPAEIAQAKIVNLPNFQTVADGYAFARNIATVNLAARQFIEFYGLSPSAVLVDTCATTPADLELQCLPDPVTGKIPPPRKLVRVTAQLQSPTVFLRLLGWNTVLLEATSISETAVLDVVMIFDTSESMLNQTSYDDWEANTPYKMHYMPPRMNSLPNTAASSAPCQYQPTYVRRNGCNPTGADWVTNWYQLLSMKQSQINADPTNFPVIAYLSDANNNITLGNINDPNLNPQPQCRVRFFPYANSIIGGVSTGVDPNVTADDVRKEYTQLLKNQGVLSGAQQYDAKYDGFVPNYNFYGCCNDPNQDGKFDDLVCQPFKKMRDATGKFLEHIDFARGDRVAFVTFDRYAYLIDPDGTTGGVGGTGPQSPMMTSQQNALETLGHVVGVRAEPSFYADTDKDGLWDSFVVGGGIYDPTDAANSGIPYRYTQNMSNVATGTWTTVGQGGFDNTPLGQLNDYPVNNNCRFQNASLTWPLSIYSSPPPEAEDGAHPYIGQRFPTPLAALGQTKAIQLQYKPPSQMVLPPTLMLPNLNDPAWDSQMPVSLLPLSGTSYQRQNKKPIFSYEAAAGCGGSNVGSALRVGNNALLNPNTVRTNGAVWVMVMLGDGAAAASDPVTRNNNRLIAGNPYGNPSQPPPTAGQYGAYGLCPYNDPLNPGPLLDDNLVDPQSGAPFNEQQPRCSDPEPESRHPYCFIPDEAHTDPKGNILINLNDNPLCDTQYDVDDYARDWADYVALSNPFPEITTLQNQDRNALQLPTIFAIGFGLDFQLGDKSCEDNVPDCLGEELLRYVADVGDNQRIDTDYQQDLKADGKMDGRLTGNEQTYGDRGPCEAAIIGYPNADAAKAANNYGAIVNRMPPKINCGNYYNAPDAQRLQQVFDDIASRMFTRLTR